MRFEFKSDETSEVLLWIDCPEENIIHPPPKKKSPLSPLAEQRIKNGRGNVCLWEPYMYSIVCFLCGSKFYYFFVSLKMEINAKKQVLKSSHLESVEFFYKEENQSEGC